MSGSVSFDRAAGYYDTTRGRTPEAAAAETAILAQALGGHDEALEIGVGTGQLALPLAAAGVRMVGLDLSAAMLRILAGKTGGTPACPVVRGDATALPFADDAFGAGLFRWVLHLIPEWRTVVAELVRVVRPGGVVLANLGGDIGGLKTEIRERFAALAGIDPAPAGLDWDDRASLEDEFGRHSATVRGLPTFLEPDAQTVADYLDALEGNRYSWTWPAEEEARVRAAAEVRAWVRAEHGSADELKSPDHEVRWRAYDLP